MDWHCRLVISIYQKIWENQILDIISATMVCYLVSFPLFVLRNYDTPSADVNSMTNILFFSLGGISTGIICSTTFLSVAETLQKDTALRKHMTIAAYGLLLFYIARYHHWLLRWPIHHTALFQYPLQG